MTLKIKKKTKNSKLNFAHAKLLLFICNSDVTGHPVFCCMWLWFREVKEFLPSYTALRTGFGTPLFQRFGLWPPHRFNPNSPTWSNVPIWMLVFLCWEWKGGLRDLDHICWFYNSFLPLKFSQHWRYASLPLFPSIFYNDSAFFITLEKNLFSFSVYLGKMAL